MSTSLGDALIAGLQDALSPLEDAVTDPPSLDQVLAALGTSTSGAGGGALATAVADIARLVQQIAAFAQQPSPSLATLDSLFGSARTTFSAIRALSGAGGSASQLAGLGDELIQLLLSSYLNRLSPATYRLAVLLTLIESADEARKTPAVVQGGQLVRDAFVIDRFHLDRLPGLIRDPLAVLRAEYLNDLATAADANAMADKLFRRMGRFLTAVGVPWRYGLSDVEAPAFGDAAPLLDHAMTVYAAQIRRGAPVDVGVWLVLSPADAADLGLVVAPFGGVTFTRQAGGWTLDFALDADVQAFAYGHNGFTLLASGASVDVKGTFEATLPKPTTGPALLLGAPNGTRVEVGGASFAASVALSNASVSVGVDGGISEAAVVLAPGDGDGFLQSVLPANGARAEFDLGLSWSNAQGLKVRGAGGMDVDVPAGLSVGPVAVRSIHLGVQANDGGVAVECSATAGLALGPVRILVERMGLSGVLTFPAEGANLGVVDGALAFKPPSGLGLSIDAGVVTGGGFLGFDPAKSEYRGAANLSIEGVGVSALGLVQTQPQVSFLLLIATTFPSPIQLGLGFSLKGVGGLAGINRSMALDALETAVWKGALQDVLFPTVPITDTAGILDELQALFPPTQGRYVFGPTAEILWGSPPILTGQVGLAIEVPDPIRLALFGSAVAQFPPDKPAVVLKVNFAGGIDFGARRLFFDASLIGSRIESYPVTGSLSLRSSWADPKNLALAVGGFNPHFQPPVGFPALSRVALDVSDGPLHLHLAAYLAITSNTFQVGAAVDLKAHVCDCDVAAHFGFDALFIENPFSFIVDVDASASIGFEGQSFAGIHVSGSLSGTAPWHAKGSASISLLFFSVGVDFDRTWGSSAPAALPAIDPWTAALRPALAEASSWKGELPPGVYPVVTFATDAGGGPVLLDPAAAVVLDEKAIPLNQPIDRFADVALPAPVRFDLAAPAVNGVGVDASDWSLVTSEFAPAQFSEMTDDEKLSAESFVALPSGIAIGADAASVGSSVGAALTYDLVILDSTRQPLPTVTVAGLRGAQLAGAVSGPSAQAPLRVQGFETFAPAPSTAPRAALKPRQFSIVSTASLATQADGVASTRYEAAVALTDYLAKEGAPTGSVQAVPRSEAA